MKSIKYARFGSLALVVLVTAACSALPKNQSLLDAEAYYASVKQNEDVLRYAPEELQRAEEALSQAGVAESEADMTSLAYVGLTRSQIALAIAERKVAKARLTELTQSKDDARLAARDLQIERAQADADALRLELEALQAVSTERGMVMTLGDVLFSTGKADLQPGAMSTMDRLALFMAEYPAKTVLIEGYTDTVGEEAFNQRLSEQRAAAVRAALIGADVSPSRISTIGYGEARPIASNDTAEGRQMNRRVEIVINN